MQNAQALTEEQIREFLKGSERIEFTGQNRAGLYSWVQQLLVAQEYCAQGKNQQGAIRSYIRKMTGLSLPQATRLRQFGKSQYARLAEISVAHLSNLRRSPGYRKLAAKWEPTRPVATSIGERRKPDPQGQSGFLRIDTVHQGDWNGVKGVYPINAVDAVTQWQAVGCVYPPRELSCDEMTPSSKRNTPSPRGQVRPFPR